MAGIVTPLVYSGRGPQSVADVNWAHPLAPKQGFVVAQHGAATVLHWRGGKQVLSISGKIYDQGGRGFGAQGASTATSSITLPTFGGVGTDGCTVLWKAQNFSSPSVAQRIYDYDTGAGAVNLALWNSATSRWAFGVRVTGATNQWEITSGGNLTDGRIVGWINDGTHTGTTGFLDGAQVSVTQTLTNSGTPLGLSGQSSFYLANRSDGLRGWVGSIQFIYYDQTKRTASEVAELSKNIWQIFKPISREIWFGTASGAYTLTASSGTYTLTGQAATLKVARTMAANQGSYALSGQAATLKVGRTLTAAQGSYSLTGQAATLYATRSLAANQGTYTLTGQDATLSKSGGDKTLTAVQGAYTLTGQDVSLSLARKLTAEQGTYTLNGQDVGLSRNGRVLQAAQGTYTLNGQEVTLNYSGQLPSAYDIVLARRRLRK